MHIRVTMAFEKCMNHSCAVIGAAVNVTQWTSPGSGHKQRQTRNFAVLYVNFGQFLEIRAREGKLMHYIPKC